MAELRRTSAKDQPGRERKIAAIGIHVARGVTSHGFAFNVTTDLRDFALINPCGITDRPVTSLEREVSRPETLPSLESIAHQAARQFGQVFNEQVLALAQPRRSPRTGAIGSRLPARFSGRRHAAPGSSRHRSPAPH